MAQEGVVLRKEVRQRLQELQKADILVGIPSYNNARTIGHVVRAVRAGMAKYFPTLRAVLVNADGGSKDGTPQVVQQATVDLDTLLIAQRRDNLFKIVTPYHGLAGKGSAFRTIFEIAQELQVKACAVVDADLRSITPEWMDLLLRPVLEAGYDFVAPYYLRHKYDGTITNTIVYPLTRALYGKRIRQPIGGDFGISQRLVATYLQRDVWQTDIARFGIDIWMSTTAVAEGYKVCQAFLGAKIHDPKEPSADLAQMLQQVVGSVFMLMELYEEVWKAVEGSQDVPVFGFRYTVGVEPVYVNLGRMLERFRLGLRELAGLWEQILSAELLQALREMAAEEPFRLPDELWVRIIYEFALAWHAKVMSRQHILRSLTPLYLGKVASFVLQTQHSSPQEVEDRLEALCLAFEQNKHYLVQRWQ